MVNLWFSHLTSSYFLRNLPIANTHIFIVCIGQRGFNITSRNVPRVHFVGIMHIILILTIFRELHLLLCNRFHRRLSILKILSGLFGLRIIEADWLLVRKVFFRSHYIFKFHLLFDIVHSHFPALLSYNIPLKSMTPLWYGRILLVRCWDSRKRSLTHFILKI